MVIAPKYKCGNCGDLHEFEAAALDCCVPSVLPVYVCPICEDWHLEERDALLCCQRDDPALRPSAAELEAAGQMRLAL